MTPQRSQSSRIVQLGLVAGALVPVIYFGAQLVAARFYPGYSFMTQSASELGSDRSNSPSVLNGGAMTTGVALLIAAAAYQRALRKEAVARWLAMLTSLAMMSTGAAAIWAGLFPLPDPRHNPGAIGAGAFALPLLFALVAMKFKDARLLRIWLLANLLLFVAMIPVMGGFTPLDLNRYRGALQRLAAGIIYLPVGLVAMSLLRRNPDPPRA